MRLAYHRACAKVYTLACLKVPAAAYRKADVPNAARFRDVSTGITVTVQLAWALDDGSMGKDG